MRTEFYDAYRDLNELYRVSQYDFRVRGRRRGVSDLRIVDDAINDTVADLGLTRTLRPDARLFLFVNLHQMLAMPLAYVDEQFPERENLEEIMRDDVRTILKSARDESLQDEISGHAVVNAISRVWGKLRAMPLDVWG